MLKLVDKLFLGNSEFKFVRVQVPLLTFLSYIKGNSSSSGRAPICDFGGFGSSPKFYP
jgi:hypothetical protein